jgi:hypothetical protein
VETVRDEVDDGGVVEGDDVMRRLAVVRADVAVMVGASVVVGAGTVVAGCGDVSVCPLGVFVVDVAFTVPVVVGHPRPWVLQHQILSPIDQSCTLSGYPRVQV